MDAYNATTLTIPVDSRTLTATYEPALDAEQQQAIEQAAASERQLADVMRVLLIHKAARTLRVEIEEHR